MSRPPDPAPKPALPSADAPPGDWADQYLAQIPSGVDATQIAERLRMTPTERLEDLQRFHDLIRGIRRPGGKARQRD